MSLSDPDMHAIIVAASSLAERRSSAFLPVGHASLPAWATLLQEIIKYVESVPATTYLSDYDLWDSSEQSAALPFKEMLIPFVIIGHQHYAEKVGSAYHLLTPKAHEALKLHLLQVLTSLAAQALYTEFSSQYAQVSHHPQTSQLDEQSFYQQFLQQATQGGLATFLCTYSVLARLLATTVAYWIDSVSEFIQRLAADQNLIQQQFAGNQAPGQVVAIEPALSNPHNGRRMVMLLTFASGCKLIYKPKDVGLEASYFNLLAWCNEQGVPRPFKILTVMPRGTYGWIEFVEQRQCENEEGVQNFYLRTGMLLCLTYVLGGKNCFYDHIIAHGEHPVLVDTSALLQPFICPDPEELNKLDYGYDWEQLTYSVLHTGLLASWDMLSPRKGTSQNSEYCIDISGFSRSKEHSASAAFQDTSQHQHLSLKHGVLKARERWHVPMYESLPLRLEEHNDTVVTGFKSMYQWLLQQRELLVAPDSPLYALRGQTVRVPYRSDRSYHTLLPKLLAASSLQDGSKRNILLAGLSQDPIPVEYYLWEQGDLAHWWPTGRAEQEAILRGDVPFFTVHTDSTTLIIDEAHTIPDCFYRPGFDLTLERLQKLCSMDMQQQTSLLQRAMAKHSTPVITIVRSAQQNMTEPPAVPDQEKLISQALAMAENIVGQSIKIGNGCATWLTPHYLMRTKRYQLQPVRYGLLDGLSGITLFLAAAAKISGDHSYHSTAYAGVQTLQQALQQDKERLASEMGIGGALGIGSVVYCLTRMAQFLDMPELFTTATQAARLITRERIARDLALDVIAGSAGAILGLLALYDVSHDQEILEQAILCSQHLLAERTLSKQGCLTWPTLNRRHTTGFSHGTAGIVYALVRLYAVTHDTALLTAADEALAYENAAFLPEMGNWADEIVDKQHGEPVVITTWCHGAPGIGLARLGGLRYLDNEQIRHDIGIALQTTQQMKVEGDDHICCGNFGRAEILWTAAQQLERPDLASAALNLTGKILSRAQNRGSLALNNLLPDWAPTLTFFHGTSGIGYTLLRMAYPQKLPAVLLWQ